MTKKFGATAIVEGTGPHHNATILMVNNQWRRFLLPLKGIPWLRIHNSELERSALTALCNPEAFKQELLSLPLAALEKDWIISR